MKNIFRANDVILTAAGQSGGGLREIDLFGRAPLPENASIELKIVSNGTAPGASKTVTVHYALSAQTGLTAAQLAEADAAQVLDIANAANTERVYTLPTIVVGQRFLYLWFDNDALAGGATLTVSPTINT